MAQRSSPITAVKKAEQASERAVASPWFERLARFGYAAKGVVYIIFGILAAQAAFGLGGQVTDKSGALETILTQPFGKILLALVAVGLIGYVLWRFVQAIIDPEHRGTDAKAIVKRIGYGLSGLIYAGLALTAVRLVIGSGGNSGGNALQDWTARILGEPLGRWLVGIAGAIIIGGGLYQLYQAYEVEFSERFKWNEMSATERTWATRLGRFGLAARGIVQGIIGIFLIQAARTFDPAKAQNSGGALAALAAPPFGLWVMGVVAVGLVAYGIYMLAAARYSRIVAR